MTPTAPSELETPDGNLDLSLVVPVYNEEAGVAELLRDLSRHLAALELEFEIRAYDDGSTDETGATLESLARELPQLVVAHHANRGHGPTILRGYRESRGRWVAQFDSDGDIPVESVGTLWRARRDGCMTLGARVGRQQSLARRVVSAGSRLAVVRLFGSSEATADLDVNTPCRLMPRSLLRELIDGLPDALFAPNVALTGLAVRRRALMQVDVPFVGRQWGRDSLGSLRLWRAAARSMAQTIAIARAARRDGPQPSAMVDPVSSERS